MALYLWSLFLVVVPPLLLVLALKFFVPVPLTKAFAAIVLIGVPIALALPWLALRFSIETTLEGIKLSGGIGYSATVDPDALANAEILPSADALDEKRPVLRINGIAIPGLAVGRFQLANGSAGVLFIHDSNKPVAVIRASRPPGAYIIVNQDLLTQVP